MLPPLRRLRWCQRVHLLAACLSLAVLAVYVEREVNVVNAVRAYSHYILRSSDFASVNRSLTITREQARAFSDFRPLLDNPGRCLGEDVLLLLFVKSSPRSSERRAAIRATWGNETHLRGSVGATVKVLFALGAAEADDSGRQEQLAAESEAHGDLVQRDFLDSFHNLTLKLLLQLHWAQQHCAHARFFMTADDDVFVHTPNLVRYLQSEEGVTDFWVGKVYRGSAPIRNKRSKYYVSEGMYPWPVYPAYTAGAGYVLSADVARRVYQATLTLNASIYIDDVFMGICGNAVGVSPRNHAFFAGESRTPSHPCVYGHVMTSHGHAGGQRELWRAATRAPEAGAVAEGGLVRRLYCTAVRAALLCRLWGHPTYPCSAAFV